MVYACMHVCMYVRVRVCVCVLLLIEEFPVFPWLQNVKKPITLNIDIILTLKAVK